MSTVALTAGGTVMLPSTRVPSDVRGTVKVGVRPEKLTITRGDDNSENGTASCKELDSNKGPINVEATFSATR